MIYGNKVNDLETLLEDVFENPGIKVVIFSQWIRMMELITVMLDVNDWGHVFLNGSVPSHKRGDLIKTFHDDPSCRVFLATEAGSTGLNLQNASVVVNMDLPWNPAVLEQRISRVHRLGQTKPVRVVNFIAEGGIEHGMLGLLRFKKSMFSGVLDKGDNDIFMGESRFNRFMKTVEEATGSLHDVTETSEGLCSEKDDAQKEVESMDEVPGAVQKADREKQRTGVSQSEILRNILQAGSSFLNQLSKTLAEHNQEQQTVKTEYPFGIRIQKNEKTGRRTLQIPLAEDETLQQTSALVEGLGELLKKWQR